MFANETLVQPRSFQTSGKSGANDRLHSSVHDSGATSYRETPRSRRQELFRDKSRSCKQDMVVAGVFGLVFFIIVILAIRLNENDLLPNDPEKLELNNLLIVETEKGESSFFELSIPAFTSVAIFISDAVNTEDEGVTLDTALTVFKRPNEVVAFNDDIALGNANPILYFFLEQEETFVVQVSTLQGEGSYAINTEIINNTVAANIAKEVFIEPDEFFLAIMSDLEVNRTYDIVAYQNPANSTRLKEDIEDEADTAIRIRELVGGEEIIEVFTGSIVEFTGKVLFTAVSGGPYILEIKGFDGNELDIIILVREITPIPIEFDTIDSSQEFPLHSQISTVLEFDILESVQYNLTLLIDLNQSFVNEVRNNFGYLYYNELYNFLYIYTDNIIPGVSFRLYDKFRNEIFQRGRTDIDIVNRTDVKPNPDVDGYFYQLADFIVTPEGTKLSFVSSIKRTILLDVTRWEPDYAFSDISEILEKSLFGKFSIEVTAVDFVEQDLNLDVVDPNNLFPDEDCDIDETKFTIQDDTCEQGILLFCRHEFAPDISVEGQLISTFQDICDCANFLCATLPSGDDLNNAVQIILIIFYVCFTILSFGGILSYLGAHLDLFIFGGFYFWVQNNKGFSTWTLCFFLLLTTSAFFISEIRLQGEIKIMQEIADEFNLGNILIPEEQFTYKYYYRTREEITGGGYLQSENFTNQQEEQDSYFLNIEARKISEGGKTFEEIRRLINFNLFCSLFKDALAIIVFLDVSAVWLASTATARLNKAKQEREKRRFQIGIRAIGTVYFLSLIIALIVLVKSNGSKYNVFPNVMALLTSILVVGFYSVTRQRIAQKFADSHLLTEQTNVALWNTIRDVSSVVIFSNIGIIIVQLYSIIEVQNFDDLIKASNDPVALMFFLFQDLCVFVGVFAILIYLFQQYTNYRDSLFIEEEGEYDEVHDSENIATKQPSGTRRVRGQVPSEYTSTMQEVKPK